MNSKKLLGVRAFLIGAVLATPAAAQNLLSNPGFEDGSGNPWFGFAGSGVSASAVQAHSGGFSGLSFNRLSSSDGPSQKVTPFVVDGTDYRVSCYARLANAPSATVRLWVRQIDGAGTRFFFMDEEVVTNGAWTPLWWSYRLQVVGALSDVTLFLEFPPANVNFYIDDCNFEAFDWLAEANQRIETIRKRDMDVLAVDSLGQGIPGVAVNADQVRHRFAFGTAINSNVLTLPQSEAFFLDHFEWATFEAAAKWMINEPAQGQLNYTEADQLRDLCNAHGIKMHGHNVFWEPVAWVQPWLQALNATDLFFEVEDRLNDVVNRYKNDFLHWDVNNEMLHGSFYRDRLGPGIWPWMYQQTRLVDPDVQLFVNDYNVIEGDDYLAYIAQIEQLMADGAPIDAIGVQGHFFSGSVNPVGVLDRLEELSVLDMPVWVTEYDAPAANPNVRADNLEKLYRAAFSHPSVQGITMWGFWAGDHWLGPDAAIVNPDWTLNAAGVRFESLLAEWTTQAAGLTNGSGTFPFRGFHGVYEITLTSGPIQTQHEVELVPASDAQLTPLALEPDECLLAGEAQALLLSHNHGTGETTLDWSAPSTPAGMNVFYDVLSSSNPANFGAAPVCPGSSLLPSNVVDTTALTPGQIRYFLVRAENWCGRQDGPLGTSSSGAPRIAGACPN